MFNGQKVFDVHGHVTAPDAYRAGATGLMASNTPSPRSILMRPDAERPGPLRDENFKQLVLTQHVQYMDERNIDVQIIGPRPFIMLGWMPNYEILVSWTRLTNDAIGKQVSYFPERFLCSLQLPQTNKAPDATHMLDEIDRCKKEWGAMSVYVSPDPEGLRQTPGMDQPYWYPLYEKCQREGLAIIVHGTNHQDPRLTPINQNYQVGFMMEQFIASQLLGFSDVFDKFPELKVVICHLGGCLSRFAPTDAHNFQRDTSKNLFYDTCAYDPPFLEAGIMQKHVSQVVFGTEAPGSGRHVDPRTGRSGDNVVPTLQEAKYLTDSDRMDIMHNTPLKIIPAFGKA